MASSPPCTWAYGKVSDKWTEITKLLTEDLKPKKPFKVQSVRRRYTTFIGEERLLLPKTYSSESRAEIKALVDGAKSLQLEHERQKALDLREKAILETASKEFVESGLLNSKVCSLNDICIQQLLITGKS